MAAADKLTERQSRMLALFMKTGSIDAASRAAGYANPVSGYVALRSPAFLQALHEETARRVTAAAPTALRVLLKLLEDEKTNVKVRADIAHRLMTMAGHGAKASRSSDLDDKTLTEMTRDQLLEHVERARQAIDKLQDELSKRATQVDSTQDSAQDEAKLLDALA